MGGKRAYSKAQSRQMFERIQRTKHTNLVLRLDQAKHRLTDPYERAVTALRSRGFHVFASSVLGETDGKIIVGRRRLTKQQVMEMALKHGMRRER